MNPPGEPIIPQSPTRKVGDTVYVSVPGPVPVIRAKRRDTTEMPAEQFDELAATLDTPDPAPTLEQTIQKRQRQFTAAWFDVADFLASLPLEFDDPGDNPWGPTPHC